MAGFLGARVEMARSSHNHSAGGFIAGVTTSNGLYNKDNTCGGQRSANLAFAGLKHSLQCMSCGMTGP